MFWFTGVNLWCNSSVTFNKHIAPRSASDILITLITMLLWIAFQKPIAPFIHGVLCLRSLHGGVIHGCSVPLYSSMHHHWRMQICVCEFVPVYVHMSIDRRFITAKINQRLLNNASLAIMEKYAEYAWAELEGVGGGMKKHKACSQLSFYVWDNRGKTLLSTLTNELRSGSRRFPSFI